MFESVFLPHSGQLGFISKLYEGNGPWPVIVLTMWDKRRFLLFFFGWVEVLTLISLTTDLVLYSVSGSATPLCLFLRQ